MNCSNELTVTVGGHEKKVFLQKGFYSSASPTQYMHKHNYAEIHFVSGGNVTFAVDDKAYQIEPDTVLVIPRGVYHGCVSIEGGAVHSAFQLDYDFTVARKYKVNGSIIAAFNEEIERCRKSGDHSTVSAFIALVCSYFSPASEAKRITDSGFLISEFFSNRYGDDVRLEELAEILHLSPRQTERLVESHTGRTFREELAFTRMTVAERLINISGMPLCQVAQYVGYRSYAGFWKAYQKYKNDLKGECAE